MQYEAMTEGIFIERRNRFVAEIEIDGKRTFAHVPNTGRCREIFVPGAKIYVSRSSNRARKYAYTLCEVYKGERLIHIDSAAANRLTEEALKAGKIRGLEDITEIEREKTFGHSRFDFRFRKDGKVCFMEVKGVTLEIDDMALFPDAPTERGARHMAELKEAKENDYGAYVLFAVQMKGPQKCSPFRERDPVFCRKLCEAAAAGVTVMAYDTVVTPAEIKLDCEIPVVLPRMEEIG